ncbi:MAG: UxaA family hydrolase [Synergistaceae bacterium]|jgi:altronate dehydratase large subunit|nr:UxaA family hydrolase [Synergistaceae bacterium]
MNSGSDSVFMGYTRADGSVGIRNHLLVLPSVVCANDTAARIALQLNGAVYVTHQHGCAQLPSDAAQTKRTLAGFGANPNVAACIVVGLGCETIQAREVAEEISKITTKPVAHLVIQEEGGTLATTAKGVRIGREMLAEISLLHREEQPLSKLILGLECGGSDAWSGLSANPAVGNASDRLIRAGGTSILSETQEMIGAEHLLAKRAVNPEVAERLFSVVRHAEEGALADGVDIRLANPTPGNRQGGLTTLEEKSLGCISKAGTEAPLQEILAFAEHPSRHGLIFMDTPGHDIESITGMVAGGAQVILFTTGRGTCTGCPIAPVIKVCSNTPTFERMSDNMDVDAGPVIAGTKTIDDIGKALFEEMLRVCSGKSTKSEDLGYGSFAINRIGPTQ